MPAYPEKNGTWTAKFKYRDWLGNRKQKTKRGFTRKKDAKDYETNFKAMYTRSADIPFESLVKNYITDLSENGKIEETTAERKEHMFQQLLIPYFKGKPINEIESLDVLNWQNWIMKMGNDKLDKGYAPTYLKTINNELSAIMNYGCRFYKLPSNPCIAAGSMGKSEADAMTIWTLDEFEQFIVYEEKTAAKVAFDILYWTGIREGELLALTLQDFLPTLKLSITKNFAIVRGEKIIKEPKTESSIREIAIPPFLYDEVQEYASKLYGLQPTDRLFMFTKSFLLKEIKRVAEKARLTPIRIHDLRHSHASLLIEMGFNILLIAERLGHKKVQTTWNTYAHLYPDKDKQIAYGLQETKLSGVTSNKTAEDQLLSLIGEIKKRLPDYQSYEKDDIILWDRKLKEKSVVSRKRFDEIVSITTNPTEAFVIMMKEGYYETDTQYVFCFSSRGMPVKYL